MKFSIQRPTFLKYLTDVQRAISPKAAIDILHGFKLELFPDALKLTGSNADITIQTIISISDEKANLQIFEEGSVVLSANIFSEIIKKLPADELEVSVDSRLQTTITSGKAEFTILGQDADMYPHLPELSAQSSLVLSSDILKKVIDQTSIAISNQESRPLLTGIHLLITDQKLLAVATDTHRLSQRTINLGEAANDAHYDLVIPGKSLKELAKMLNDDHSEVEIQIADNQVLFILGHTSFYSRLLEGNYPDTKRLIPQTSETTATFNAQGLLQAIERSSLVSHAGRNNVVKFTLDVENQEVIITGNSPEVGTVEESISFSELTGKNLEISFNPDYMRDALRSLGNTETTLEFTMPLRPFILVPTEAENDFIQLITPVRTA